MHAISLLITTHEYFYSMQRNIKLRNKSQHHITIITQLFWVWKPQDGKTGAAIRYRFYYEKIWNFYNHCKFTQTWQMQYPAESLGKIPAKPQHPPVWVYGPVVRRSMILLLTPPSSQLNPLSDFLSLSVSYLYQNTSVCVLSTNWSLFYNFR